MQHRQPDSVTQSTLPRCISFPPKTCSTKVTLHICRWWLRSNKSSDASQRGNDWCGSRRRRYSPRMSILSANGRTSCDERTDSAKSHEASGLIAGIAAFTTWGLIPIYWKLLAAVPATEILAHRFVWTTIFLSILLSWQPGWPQPIANLRSPRPRIYCLTAGLATASNLFLFLYAA